MEQQHRLPLRTLVLIGGAKLSEQAGRVLQADRMPLFYQLRGQGTATSETMDLLGLGSTTKIVSVCMLPKVYADRMVALLERELHLGKPGTGVAFTTAITGMSTPALKIIDENARREFMQKMEDDRKQLAAGSENSLIVAVVNQGFSEAVMEAAREGGAKGGTVLHARQAGAGAIKNFLGISIQEEKEMVLILAHNKQKLPIMKVVGERCGMQSKARGIVISTPIDAIAGFEAPEQKEDPR